MPARFRTLVLGGLAAVMIAAGPAEARGDEPLARFEDSICPGVAGLKTDAAEYMVGRIRANIEALGLRLADERVCEPNIVVIFVKSGKTFFERMKKETPYLFSDLTQAERDELLSEEGAARALLRVVPRSRDGVPVPRQEDLVSIPQTTMWMAHSKIYTATQNDIYHALILFDRDKIKELSIDQLADYATFRALSQTLPSDTGASILALFDGGTEEGLTEFDHAWLGALYRGPPNIPGSARLAELEKATGWKGPVEE